MSAEFYDKVKRYIKTFGTPFIMGGSSIQASNQYPNVLGLAATNQSLFFRVKGDALDTGSAATFIFSSSDGGNLKNKPFMRWEAHSRVLYSANFTGKILNARLKPSGSSVFSV